MNTNRAPIYSSVPVACVGVSVGVDIHNGKGVAVRMRLWADGKIDVDEETEFATRKDLTGTFQHFEPTHERAV